MSIPADVREFVLSLAGKPGYRLRWRDVKLAGAVGVATRALDAGLVDIEVASIYSHSYPSDEDHVCPTAWGRIQAERRFEQHGKRRLTWQQAAAFGEKHLLRNPFPGVNALARLARCSQSTMLKAINLSTKLRAAYVEHQAQPKSVSAREMPEGVETQTVQSREEDPLENLATDEIFQQKILPKARTPEEREKLENMTPAKRRELVAMYANDPDAGQHVRKPSRRCSW